MHARNWGWRHGGRLAWALDGVDLDIAPGERVLVLGPSGSGKSTLLGGIAGLLGGEDEGEARGTLTVDAADPSSQRGRIGLVMQDPEAQVVLARVGDDTAFGMENLQVPPERIWPRVDRALAEVGLDVPHSRSTSALSGGQKQRLALASILAMRPGLLILDEPTANLDPDGVADVRDAVERVLAASGATLVVVEHRVDVWADLVDRAVVVLDGRIAADGPLDDVLASHGRALRDRGIWLPGDDVAGAVGHPLRPRADNAHPGPGGAGRGLDTNPDAPGRPTRPDDRHDLDAQSPPPGRVDHAERIERAAPAGAAGRTPTGRNAVHDHPILTARGLAIGYSPDHPVRAGIDLDIERGRSTCLVGANGTGKSTLALTLAGLLPALVGTIEAHPADPPARASSDPHDWRSADLLGRISMVFQEPEYQFVARTVREELEIGPRRSGVGDDEIDALVDEHLDALGLTALAGANPMTLSGGEKRRLSVATALISAPELLILDEPTFGQDRTTWIELVRLLRRSLDRGTTLVSITHDPAYVEAMGDVVIEMSSVHEDAFRRSYGNVLTGKRVEKHGGAQRSGGPGPSGPLGVSESPGIPGRSGPLGRINPVIHVLALIVMTTPLLVSIDPVSAGIALVLELPLILLARIRPAALALRMTPLLLAAPIAALSMLLYANPGGQVYWALGPAIVSERSVRLALGIFVRVLAVGLPAIVLLTRIDPTDMADGLAQVLRLPARPVLATLAAARMTGLMAADWKALEQARRIRGIGDSRKVVSAVRGSFSLLVFALRRSAKLSLTMEARGFGAASTRTWARPSKVGAADAVMMAVAVVIPTVALTAAVATGHFELIGR
ncbi:ATP-binding cassette domain-containing protein [Actinomyces sp. B33]|nr:ATP-binding cassette domain-containing protein [Actinomyces sp. B33]MDC4233900.1 ATP-binding cassette domain-containing protein [Actinomyces sp. B33]